MERTSTQFGEVTADIRPNETRGTELDPEPRSAADSEIEDQRARRRQRRLQSRRHTF